MRLIRGWWLPNGDDHFERLFGLGDGRPVYQGRAQQAALGGLRGRRGLMVDVGAHVGLWAGVLGSAFERVCCFEPILENRECLIRNAPRAEVYPYALWGAAGKLRLGKPTAGNSGSWEASEGGEKVRCRTLDEFGLSPDLVKIDVQGGEVEVLRGGEATILESWPLVVVEDNPDASSWLRARGYRLVFLIGKDAVYVADQA